MPHLMVIIVEIVLHIHITETLLLTSEYINEIFVCEPCYTTSLI